MKHIFSVHSPVTFLISHAAIEYLKLEVDDVIILSNGYKLPIDKYYCAPYLSNLRRTAFQKLLQINAPMGEDRYLSGLLKGEEFIAYIDLMSFHQRVFITHPNCRGFHFIEEGNASYRDNDTLDDLTWDKRQQFYRIKGLWNTGKEMLSAAKWAARGYSHRLLSIPYSYNNYNFFEGVKFFGFSELTYPVIKSSKKVVVPLKASEELRTMAGNVQLEDCIIWLDGSGKSFTHLPDEMYHRAINEGIEKLYHELSSKPVCVKLRPGIKDFNNNYLYKTLKQKGFDVSVMSNDLIIECVFAISKNCIIVGNLSSALFYASTFGHKSYSIYALFEKKVPTVFDQMSAFWSKVERLQII